MFKYKKIIELIIEASKIAKKLGIFNILQPGLVKEMIIAEKLNHKLIFSKNGADACNIDNPIIKYEYLSCIEKGTGQLDRMFSRPLEKRKKSLQRILRNNKIYLSIFYKNNQLKIKSIYEIDPQVMIQETERQLDNSSNDIAHIGFSENWAAKNGNPIYTAE